MAVYTKLSTEEIQELLNRYDIGALVDYEGIVQGVENSNYKIQTDKDKFILTIFEARTNEADLPFFFDFMAHLHGHGIYCPFVIEDKNKNRIQKINSKSAALFSFLDGNNIAASDITLEKCFQMGGLLAQMHIYALSFPQVRNNSMSLLAWKEIYSKIEGKTIHGPLIEDELVLAQQTLSLNLPKAVCHLDAFPDNIFEHDEKICGVIDFYFSAYDLMAYDLAITLNAWCFENGEVNSQKINNLLQGYEALRPLQITEKEAFQNLGRAAALRILMTREH
ncbi:MAG: homoserine kinase, partial [Micavibrio aeruginosavorus]